MTQKTIIHTVRTQEDAGRVSDLARIIWAEHYTPIIGSGQVQYMLNRFQSATQIWQDVTDHGCTYLWMTTDEQTVAYMAYCDRPDEQSCFLSKLYVRKDCRGRGFAKELVNGLVRRCRDEKKRRIWLTVNKNNTHSIAAYKKMMFYKTGLQVTDIGGGYVMDDVVMQRDLT